MRLSRGTRDPVWQLVVGWLVSLFALAGMFLLSVTQHRDLFGWWGTASSLLTGIALLSTVGFFLAALTAAQPLEAGTVLADRDDLVLVQLDRVAHPFRLFVGGGFVGLILGIVCVFGLPYGQASRHLIVAFLLAVPLGALLRRGRRLRLHGSGIQLGRCQSLVWDRLEYLELRSATYDHVHEALVLVARSGRSTLLPLPLEVGQGLARLISPRLPRRVRPHRLAPWLARAGRELPVWTAALGQLLEGREGYREINLHPADLVDALVDTRAPLEERIGAALALRAVGHCGWEKLLTRAAEGLALRSRSRKALLGVRDGVLERSGLDAAASEELLEDAAET